MVSLVASPNGLITSRRQTISVSVSPTPYESFIGHLPGVTFSANCSLSILCQLYYRCLFKTVCARNNSPNKGTASDEKDMFSHHKGLIYLNLSSWDKWYIQTVGQLRFENWHWVLITEKKRWMYILDDNICKAIFRYGIETHNQCGKMVSNTAGSQIKLEDSTWSEVHKKMNCIILPMNSLSFFSLGGACIE